VWENTRRYQKIVTAMRASSFSYRADIDGLRALAVLPVVFFHAFPGKVPGGFAGVDVFFVISGYLITHIIQRGLRDGDFSFADFYAHRVRRILPALLTVLAACLAFGWTELLPFEYAQLSRHAAAGAGFAENFVLWSEAGYFDTVTELKPLMHLWSLSIEEQFYLLYPVVLWAAWRLRIGLVLPVTVLALASFAANLVLTAHDPVQAFFGPHARMWELLAGALLALAPSTQRGQHGPQYGRNALSVAGLALLLVSYAGLHAAQAYPGWRALLPVAATLLLLHAGPQALVNRLLLARRPLVLIGTLSYPLYLWHWPLLSFARIADGLPAVERNGAVLLALMLAWLTWLLIERPIRRGPAPVLKAAMLCTGLLVLGGAAWVAPAQPDALTARVARFTAANARNAPVVQSCRFLTGQDHAEDWCNAGNAGARVPDTVLLGDSFANAYVNMFAADGSTAFVQLGRGQCPALLDYGPDWCRDMVRAQAGYVAAHPQVRTVVLAAHWPAYDAGQRWSRFNVEESQDAFRRAFRRTVDHYQGLGRRVVVLLSPPTGANPETCVPRPWHLVEKNVCRRTRQQAAESDGAYRAAMLPWLASRGAAVFDPFPLLCDERSCALMDGERMLYADWLHLGNAGGAYLARRGATALRQALGSTR
jgi:peptidoglycan/LPS O-acetylase OafA/YrhL